MSYVQLFTKIPWRQVIGFTPEIVAVAQTIYDNVKKTLGVKGSRNALGLETKELSLAALDRRLERLEANEVQQAELVRNMACQVGELSTALRILSKRLLLACMLALAAGIGFVVLAIKAWV